jgi:outer membrane protein OmpA-like peptidoglycan-associated protein
VSLAVPLVLSMLGKQATQGNAALSAGAVADLLRDQAGPLGRLAPAGLASVLGVTQCGDVAPARVYTPPPAPVPVPVKESGMGWLRWLLPLLLLPLLFSALRSCRSEPVRQVEAPPLAPVPAAPAPAPAKVLIPQALSCGQSLDVAEGGIEQQLVGFIDDKAAAIDKDKWFSFDRLEFETDKADLMPVSGAQLKNIAEIMTCYPSLALKIGGYTDSTANAAYNLKLSQDRADNTMKALVALGVDPSRLSAEGYGEQFPVASNDTEEGRQKNRRIDVSVRKK